MVAAARSRIASLDGIRGLAALIVVFTHSESIFSRRPMEAVSLHHSPAALLLSGEAAVSMFFILSGYVLARSSSRGKDWVDTVFFFIRRIFHPPSLRRGAAARVARLLRIRAGGERGDAVQHHHRVPRCASRARPDVGEHAVSGRRIRAAGTGMDVENRNALLVRASVDVVDRDQKSLERAAGVVDRTDGLGSGEHPTEWFAVHFSVGIIVYLERDRIAGLMDRLPRFGHWMIAALGLALFVYPEYELLKYDSPRGAVLLYVLGSALLMVSSIYTRPVRNAMSTVPMRMFGRISYSVYLLHMPVILVCLPLARELSPPWLSWIAFAIPIVVISCVVGWIFERYFDRYSTRAGQQVCRWLAQFRGDATQRPGT